MSLPTYESTVALITQLKLDAYSDETLEAVRAQQFLAFKLATPQMPDKDRETLFAMIWDTARVAGYFQSVRAQEAEGKAIQAAIMDKVAPKLQRMGILPTCSNPECEHCRVIDHERNPKPSKEVN